MSNTTPPGWYPDAQVPGQQRYWDGAQWTSHTAPATAAAASPVNGATPTSASKRNWFVRHKILTAVLALVVLSGISGALSGGGDDKPPAKAPAASTEVADAEPAQADVDAVADPEPVDTDGDGVADDEDFRPQDADIQTAGDLDTDEDGVSDDEDLRPKDPQIQTEDDIDTDGDGVPDYQDDFPKNAEYSLDTDGDTVPDKLDAFPKDPEYSKDSDGDRVADAADAFPLDPSRSKITLAMENALSSAESYLDYTAFSRLGLIDQLSSDYGEGFELADATWAVDHLHVDWNEQAVKAARQYLDYTSFSRQGLIDQLSSAYGEQFTVEQAVYAVNKIGL